MEQPKVTITNQIAIYSLITFVVGLIASFIFPILSVVFYATAFFLGRKARQQIKASAGKQTGNWMALVGMVGGGVLAIVIIIWTILVLVILGPAIGNVFSTVKNNFN